MKIRQAVRKKTSPRHTGNRTVGIDAARTNFSALVKEAACGKEIIITKAGKPMARLMPLEKKTGIAASFGMFKGDIWISDDFDAPLPPDVLKSFGIEE